jgi:hypothetical protein
MNEENNSQTALKTCAAADVAIVSLMICCIAATFPILRSNRADRVAVFRQNALIAEYPLEEDIAFTVSGKRGPLEIEIKSGVAKIVHADCTKRVCKITGGISHSYEQLICAPNNILVEIRAFAASDTHDIDGISY